jgi:hypothetical protein
LSFIEKASNIEVMSLKVIYGISLILLVVATALFFVFLFGIDHSLIIHFDKYKGIDLWGNTTSVLGIIILGFVINAINFGFGVALTSRKIINTKRKEGQHIEANPMIMPLILGFSSMFVSILILISIGVTISVN